jgi:hypothetical protein
MEGFFEIANKEFYFDLDTISEFIKVTENDSLDDILSEMSIPEGDDVNGDIPMTDIPQGQMVDVTKWEMTKAMVETILSENSIVDEKIGLGDQLSIPFRISFNTLLKNKLIKENG